jgi:hypothetical protein
MRGRSESRSSESMSSVHESTDEILRLLLARLVGGAAFDEDRLVTRLGALGPSEVEALALAAAANRFDPAVGFLLAGTTLKDRTPDSIRRRFEPAWRHHRLRNRTLVAMADRVFAALEAAGERPVLFKGIHYVDWLSPDLGARVLQDLDLVMPGANRDRCIDALRPLGFQPIDEPESDAIHLRHRLGIEIDLHHRFRIFEGIAGDPTADHLPRHGPTRPWRVFGRSPELATLIHHHCGPHLEVEGTRLCWLADLALRLQVADVEDPEEVFGLVGDPRRIERLGWILDLLERDLGLSLPRWRDAAPAPRSPARWSTAMASTRMLPMGLPRPRGWARWIASLRPAWRTRWGPRPSLADLRRLREVWACVGRPTGS